HAGTATASAATALYVDDVDVDLPVVLNIYAVVDLVYYCVVATINVIDDVAFVAVNVAQVQVLFRRTLHLVPVVGRIMMMNFRLVSLMLWEVAHNALFLLSLSLQPMLRKSNPGIKPRPWWFSH